LAGFRGKLLDFEGDTGKTGEPLEKRSTENILQGRPPVSGSLNFSKVFRNLPQ